MSRNAKLRLAGLSAMVTIFGSLYLGTPAAAATRSYCSDIAYAYAKGYCDGRSQSVDSYTFSCSSPNATPFQISVTCK